MGWCWPCTGYQCRVRVRNGSSAPRPSWPLVISYSSNIVAVARRWCARLKHHEASHVPLALRARPVVYSKCFDSSAVDNASNCISKLQILLEELFEFPCDLYILHQDVARVAADCSVVKLSQERLVLHAWAVEFPAATSYRPMPDGTAKDVHQVPALVPPPSHICAARCISTIRISQPFETGRIIVAK